MTEYKGVMVYGEVVGERLASSVAEGLGIGGRLAEALGEGLAAVLVGSGIGGLAQGAIALGARSVYIVDDPHLKDYRTDAYVAVLAKVVGQARPRIIIMGHTDVGRDLAPALSFRLGTAVITDGVGLAIDAASRRLRVTKPVYGGNARAVFVTDTDPQVVTIRPKTVAPAVPDASRQGDIIGVEAGLEASALKTVVLGRVVEDWAGVKLEDAAVVVSGGRGMGGAGGFQQLLELAGLLRGAVGASRPACDYGWVPDTLQVGLTGRVIAPDVYIAVGISGSSQHMSGCAGARNIIAINKDPGANIFRYTRFGVVGDWQRVLPAFTRKVRELLAA
jgi:electron transfer flavoprotein alpha subunit